MHDINLGDRRPGFAHQGDGGCFPIVAWQAGGRIVWGAEAVMLAAGTNVEWLRDDLGIIASATESHDVASLCETRSEEHTSELQSLMRISYAVFCLKKKKHSTNMRHKKHKRK